MVADKLATTSRDGNRHLLARFPVAGGNVHRKQGARRAASIETRPKASALLKAITRGPDGDGDPHLAAFVPLPGKDNGFDIEGLDGRLPYRKHFYLALEERRRGRAGVRRRGCRNCATRRAPTAPRGSRTSPTAR